MVDDSVWEKKDLRITRQSCIGYANDLLRLANEMGLLGQIKTYDELFNMRIRLSRDLVDEVYREVE